MQIPELEHGCGSWVVSSKQTGNAVFETYSRKTDEVVNQENYTVETAMQYLYRLNKESKK